MDFQSALPSVFASCDEELDLTASICVLDVSSEAELEEEEEEEELVEFVEQDLDDSDDSVATQFRLSFFLGILSEPKFSPSILLLLSESLLLGVCLSSLFLCLLARAQ